MAKQVFTELYDLVGVPSDASQDDIKKAFRRKAREYHPDNGGGDPAKMVELNAAYAILKDPEKRAKYDRDGISTFEAEKTHIPEGYEQLHSAFREVTQNGPSPFMRADFTAADLVKKIQDYLRKKSEKNAESLVKAREGIDKLRHYLERMDAPDDSWLVRAIEADILAMEGTLQSGEMEQRALEGALNLLEGHKYKHDPEARANEKGVYHDGGIFVVDDMDESVEDMVRRMMGKGSPFG